MKNNIVVCVGLSFSASFGSYIAFGFSTELPCPLFHQVWSRFRTQLGFSELIIFVFSHIPFGQGQG